MPDYLFVRATDPLGRIVIPQEIRRSLGIKPTEHAHFGITLNPDGTITLVRLSTYCKICGTEQAPLYVVDDIADQEWYICDTCSEALTQKLNTENWRVRKL